MAKDGKKALVPKLRFPEFRDDPEWADAKLEELITTITPPAKLPSSNYRQIGKYPIVDQSQQAICGWTDDASAVIEDAWPLIVFGDHTCVLKLIRQPFAQGADGIKIFKARAAVATEYLFHALNHRPLVMEDYKRHFSILKERRVFYPSVVTSEQQKIADCLSSLDELIAAQGRKVEALKTYKRGLMQQLFPREGETLPRLRFPEFRDAPEWKSEQLDALAKRGSGHTPNKSISDYYNGRIKWISLADSKRLDKGLISQTSIEISQQGLDNSSAVLHPAGSVVLSHDAEVGKNAVMGMPMAVSQHFIVWTCHEKRMSNWFLYYVLQKMKPIFESIATGSTIKTIGVPFFRDMTVMLPTLPEQQKIAELLFALDGRIATESERLIALKSHKMGLMQQLFPSLEEA